MKINVRAVIGVIKRGSTFLVIKRAADIRAGGKFCFPGGSVEEGETEVQALVREMMEELNVHAEIGNKIAQSHTAWGTELNWYHVSITDVSAIKACHSEVESVHWMTREQMLELAELLPTNLEFLHKHTKV